MADVTSYKMRPQNTSANSKRTVEAPKAAFALAA
jgi:hypothetical protein